MKCILCSAEFSIFQLLPEIMPELLAKSSVQYLMLDETVSCQKYWISTGIDSRSTCAASSLASDEGYPLLVNGVHSFRESDAS